MSPAGALAQLRHQDDPPAHRLRVEVAAEPLHRNLPLVLVPVRAAEDRDARRAGRVARAVDHRDRHEGVAPAAVEVECGAVVVFSRPGEVDCGRIDGLGHHGDGLVYRACLRALPEASGTGDVVSDWLDDRAPPAGRGAGDVRIRAKLWPMTVGRLPLAVSGMIALALVAAGCRSDSFITHGSHLSRHVHGRRESRHLPPHAGSSPMRTCRSPCSSRRPSNPSFLAWHPSQPVLYAVSETDTVGAAKSGAVMAFRIDGSGGLTRINQEPSGGGGACYVSVNARGHVRIRRELRSRQRRRPAPPRRRWREAGVRSRAAHGIRSARHAPDPRARALDSRDAGQPVRARGGSRRRPALRVSLRRIDGHPAAAPAAVGRGFPRSRTAPLRARTRPATPCS